MKTFRALVIDDERLARDEIREHLRSCSFIELTGEAADADQAEEMISSLQPDLIFLDIQMPERSGLDLLESLDNIPEVVFTTAYDQYAVKAFELNALDYLVKPIRRERFEQTLHKLSIKFNSPEAQHNRRNIFIREGERFYIVKLQDIFLIESAGNYARLHTDGKKHYIRRSLNQLEKMLDPEQFIRVSRTEIVNVDKILRIVNQASGRLMITLKQGNVIEASGRQSAVLKSKLTL